VGSFALSWATDGSDWTTGGAEYGAGRAAAATTDGADEAESVVPSLIASAWDVADDAFLAGALAVGCQPPMTGFGSSFGFSSMATSSSTFSSASSFSGGGAAITWEAPMDPLIANIEFDETCDESATPPGSARFSMSLPASGSATQSLASYWLRASLSCCSQSGSASLDDPETGYWRAHGSKNFNFEPKSKTKRVNSGIGYFWIVLMRNLPISSV